MEKKGIPFRQIHLDFHTSPLIGDIGAEFDAEGIWGNKKTFDSSYYSWKCICYNNKDYQKI